MSASSDATAYFNATTSIDVPGCVRTAGGDGVAWHAASSQHADVKSFMGTFMGILNANNPFGIG